jgi:hypothetical protein
MLVNWALRKITNFCQNDPIYLPGFKLQAASFQQILLNVSEKHTEDQQSTMWIWIYFQNLKPACRQVVNLKS